MIFLLRMNLKRNARNMRIRAFRVVAFLEGDSRLLIFATVSALLENYLDQVQNAPKYPFFKSYQISYFSQSRQEWHPYTI